MLHDTTRRPTLDRVQKQEMVASLHETFEAASSVVVSHFKGLTASEATNLRRRMHAAGAEFRVTKNSMARRALEGTPYAGLSDLFSGPVAVAFSDDPLAAARASVEFAKENDHLVILGGGLGEKRRGKACQGSSCQKHRSCPDCRLHCHLPDRLRLCRHRE